MYIYICIYMYIYIHIHIYIDVFVTPWRPPCPPWRFRPFWRPLLPLPFRLLGHAWGAHVCHIQVYFIFYFDICRSILTRVCRPPPPFPLWVRGYAWGAHVCYIQVHFIRRFWCVFVLLWHACVIHRHLCLFECVGMPEVSHMCRIYIWVSFTDLFWLI